jgi:hypothetical protein
MNDTKPFFIAIGLAVPLSACTMLSRRALKQREDVADTFGEPRGS